MYSVAAVTVVAVALVLLVVMAQGTPLMLHPSPSEYEGNTGFEN